VSEKSPSRGRACAARMAPLGKRSHQEPACRISNGKRDWVRCLGAKNRPCRDPGDAGDALSLEFSFWAIPGSPVAMWTLPRCGEDIKATARREPAGLGRRPFRSERSPVEAPKRTLQLAGSKDGGWVYTESDPEAQNENPG